jgi:hypothetical protein
MIRMHPVCKAGCNISVNSAVNFSQTFIRVYSLFKVGRALFFKKGNGRTNGLIHASRIAPVFTLYKITTILGIEFFIVFVLVVIDTAVSLSSADDHLSLPYELPIH